MASCWWVILFLIDEFFIFSLRSVIYKKYTNANGKDSKYTNVIDISITGSCGMGTGRRHRVTCRGRGRRRRHILWERVGSWLYSSIFSFTLFIYVSCDFLPRSCLLGSFVAFFDVLSMFILSKRVKVNKK